MRFFCLPLVILVAAAFIPLAAQTNNQPGSPDIKTELPADLAAPLNPFNPGDQSISLSLGGDLPLFFQIISTGEIKGTNLSFGGIFTFSYAYYFLKGFAVGGEVDGTFLFSVSGTRTLFMAPLTAELTYTPVAMPFEFPISLGLGGVFVKLGDYFRMDPILKPSVGVSYRTDQAWSFGTRLSYWWIPQIMSTATNSVYGNFLQISLTACYHL
jgi:hypothetical protein